MATKFNTMLAPINMATGDGRRFATGAITLAPTPFPLEWVRSREGGHDGAVTVGAVHETSIATVAQALEAGWVTKDAVKSSGLDAGTEAIWGSGVMFDDVDREELPTLAEDVAQAMHLIGQGVLGPSVDLDSFEGIPVREGTDQEITWDDIEQAEVTGEELKIELLVTEGRVRAGTLVSIPAFMETSRPLELILEEATEDQVPATTAALIASVAAPARPLAVAFDMPALDGPTPITFDWDKGLVYGHIAVDGTCHAGFADVCITPPVETDQSYSWFNRYPVDTEDGGVVWAGRLTVGGRHPGLSLTASATMSAYDGKVTAADVRVAKDRFGIVVAGAIRPNLDEATKRVLSRRKVSGDWRETPGGLSLVELLALSPGPRLHSEPGFPVATHVTRGRQTALTASLGPDPDADALGVLPVRLSDRDIERVLAYRDAREKEKLARRTAADALSATLKDEHDAVMMQSKAALAAVLGQGD